VAYRIAKALDTLRAQVNGQWPTRNKASDGWIGDISHSSRASDHNPWVKDGSMGVVTAFDITHDPAHGVDAGQIAETINSDPRVKYVIWNRRIYNPSVLKAWRKYNGVNPHTKHVHVSVRPEKAHYDNTKLWSLEGVITVPGGGPVVTPEPAPVRPLLKRGSKGQYVRNLQALLGITVDGDFGPKTEAAVKGFQKANALIADGKVGPYTWDVLEGKGVPPTSPPHQDHPARGMARFQEKHGWPKHHAAAFIGRAQQEAYPEIRTGVLGDDETAFGGWQWRLDRQARLKHLAETLGVPATDWNFQIDFVPLELATTETRAGRLLKQADTIEKACAAAMAYCRPRRFRWMDPDVHGWDETMKGAMAGHGWANTLRNAKALM
jgi:hypothetical protein